MTNETLYRRIPEKGKHPARSKKNPGAISGAALDDVTNKPSGTSDFLPVELSPEEYLRQQKRAAFWRNLIFMVYDAAAPRVRFWWENEARPKLENETLPNFQRKVSSWLKRSTHKRSQKQASSVHTSALGVSHQKQHTDIAFSAEFDEAYHNYTVNMSSEEAQKELWEAFVLLFLTNRKFQRLSHAQIIDSNGNITSGADVIGLISKPEVLQSINQMLLSNPSLLEEWQAKALSDALGRDLVQDKQFIPIRKSELLRLNSGEILD